MTQQEGQFPQETATESLLTGTDPVSRDQEALDQDKSLGTPPASTVSQQDHDRQAQEITRLQGDIRGLQSIVQRSETAVGKMQSEREALQLEERLAGLPEEQRALGGIMGEMMKEIAVLKNQAPPNGATAHRDGGVTEDRRTFVEGFGVSPDDPRLDYTILDSPSGTEQTRQTAFMDSIYRIKMGAAEPAATPAAQPPATPEVRPPAPDEAPTTRGLVASENDLVDQLATGKLTPSEFREKKRQIGSTLPIG